MNFKRDLFEPDLAFSIEEAEGSVDGRSVLGKIKGTFFVPDGISRNKRFYPKSLWEKVCTNPEIRKKLTEKRMLGTIGHHQDINDQAILDGKISHIVTNLEIQNGQGIGEALILDTPAGKVLNTLLRAGCKLFVSSRADGSFKGEEKGVPKVDPDTYHLVGFDVVCDPGFMQANPGLVEAFNKILGDIPTNIIEGDDEMDTKLLESMAKENGSLKNDLEKAMTEVETVKSQNTILATETNSLKSRLDAQKRAESLVEKYRILGSPEELEKVLDVSESKIQAYKNLGSVSDLSKAIESAEKQLLAYKAIGSVKDINDALDKSMSIVAAYKAIGTPKEIGDAFDKMETKVEALRKDSSAKRISELAKELKVSEDKIKQVYGKLTEAQIKSLFSDVVAAPKAKSAVATTYVKKGPIAEGAKPSKISEDPNDNPFKRTRGERLSEMFGGGSVGEAIDKQNEETRPARLMAASSKSRF
jgi:hypothetical protein